jgi:hypothetical protein
VRTSRTEGSNLWNPSLSREGTEVEVVIPDRRKDFARFDASFGGWSGLLDFEAFEEGRRESRKLTRPVPPL